ncbi:MAG TPA: hypothetical protein VM821_05485 [Abditibacteriaceae bacterium]|nr:hypothetical protein [Abditibacteriaceae bacterium]
MIPNKRPANQSNPATTIAFSLMFLPSSQWPVLAPQMAAPPATTAAVAKAITKRIFINRVLDSGLYL